MASRARPAASSKPKPNRRRAARERNFLEEVICVYRIGASPNGLSSNGGLIRSLQTRAVPYRPTATLSADRFLHNVRAHYHVTRFAQRASMDRARLLFGRHSGMEPSRISLSSLRTPRPLSSEQGHHSPISSRAARPSSLGTP